MMSQMTTHLMLRRISLTLLTKRPFIRRHYTNQHFKPFNIYYLSSSYLHRHYSTMSNQRTEDEWRAILTPEQFYVLRQGGTEAPFTGKYYKHKEEGTYHCVGCGAPLYKSNTKFDSGCGWPAFFDAIPGKSQTSALRLFFTDILHFLGAIIRLEDRSLGMVRTEIRCATCHGHLGHVFKGEGFPTPTDERHCVNSISLRFSTEK
jgi:peptide-methionine (R)-S-oxide reductase